jgi:hypothetical protein
MFSSSEVFILNGKKSSAFQIANAGFDVWLGNNRGNLYSKKHESLDPENPEEQAKFWDFCFEEMGKYDVKA